MKRLLYLVLLAASLWPQIGLGQSCEELADPNDFRTQSFYFQFPTLYLQQLRNGIAHCPDYEHEFGIQMRSVEGLIAQYRIAFEKRTSPQAHFVQDSTSMLSFPQTKVVGWTPFCRKGKYALGDGEGWLMTDFEFDWAQDYDRYFALAELGRERYLIDQLGHRYRAAFWVQDLNASIEAFGRIPMARIDSVPWDQHLEGLKLLWVNAETPGFFPMQPNKLPHLEQLFCAQISDTSIFSMSGLRQLSLDSCSFPVMKGSGKLPQLVSLRLSRNAGAVLGTFVSELTHLEALQLDGGELKSIPASISKLTRLKYLGFSGNLYLEEFPMAFCKLDSLQELSLSMNQFTTFPKEIGNLKQVRRLEVGNTPLTALPKEFYSLQELQYLHIYESALKEISPELGRLHALRSLSLHGGQLKGIFPDVLDQLPMLEFLDLGSNGLTTMPPSLSSLQVLRVLILERNELDEFPREIRRLQHLERLLIGYNPCTDTPEKQNRIRRQMKRWLPDCNVDFE